MNIADLRAAEAAEASELLRSVGMDELGLPEEALWTKNDIRERCLDSRYVALAARNGWWNIEGLLLGFPPEAGVGTIAWVVVKSAYRGVGVGATLFDLACERYLKKGCHKLKLTAPTERAVRFYTQQGMVVEGEFPDHWWHRRFWGLGYYLQGAEDVA